MSEKAAPVGFTVFSCRPNAPTMVACQSCGDHVERTVPCAFELRGPKAGQVCGKQLCRVCACVVHVSSKVNKRMCPPHARLVAKERAK